MKLRTILASTAVAVVATPSLALAQTPPVGGGVDVGGSVNSFIELVLPQSPAFPSFKKTKAYQTAFTAQITVTDPKTQLSIADGDVTKGSKLGRISVGKKLLPSPLEAAVGRKAFQPLNGTVDPLLTSWGDVGTRMPATVKLRQKIKGKVKGSYRKLVLVTLSTETP